MSLLGTEIAGGARTFCTAYSGLKSRNPKTSVIELISSPSFRIVVDLAGDTARSSIVFSGNRNNFYSQTVSVATNIPTRIVSDSESIFLVTSKRSGACPENIAMGFIKSEEENDGNFF
jgi:hypothetical protein